MLLYEDARHFDELGDMYFDAPDWFGTASAETFHVTVEQYPFHCEDIGLDRRIALAFRKNHTYLSSSDLQDIVAFINEFYAKYTHQWGTCIVLCGSRIVQVSIFQDYGTGEYRNGYDIIELIFDDYTTKLYEGVNEEYLPKVKIGTLPANTMVYIRYPYIYGDGERDAKRAEEGKKCRYAMILPANTRIEVNPDGSEGFRLVVKSTSKDKPSNVANTVTVEEPDLSEIAYFHGTSYLKPQCLCYVNNDVEVRKLADVANPDKLRQIKNEVENFAGEREITVMHTEDDVELLNTPSSAKCQKAISECRNMTHYIARMRESLTLPQMRGKQLVVLFEDEP